jgi:hypothetical protein
MNFIQEQRFSFVYHKNELSNKFFTSSLIHFCSSDERAIPFKCWRNSKSLKMSSSTNNQFFFFDKIHFFSYLLTLKWHKPSEFYTSKVTSFKHFLIYTETFKLTLVNKYQPTLSFYLIGIFTAQFSRIHRYVEFRM